MPHAQPIGVPVNAPIVVRGRRVDPVGETATVRWMTVGGDLPGKRRMLGPSLGIDDLADPAIATEGWGDAGWYEPVWLDGCARPPDSAGAHGASCPLALTDPSRYRGGRPAPLPAASPLCLPPWDDGGCRERGSRSDRTRPVALPSEQAEHRVLAIRSPPGPRYLCAVGRIPRVWRRTPAPQRQQEDTYDRRQQRSASVICQQS